MTQSPTDSLSKRHIDLPGKICSSKVPATPCPTPAAGVSANVGTLVLSDVDDELPKSFAFQRKKAATARLGKIITAPLEADEPHPTSLSAERKRAATLALGKVLAAQARELRSPPPLATSPPWSPPRVSLPHSSYRDSTGSPTDTHSSNLALSTPLGESPTKTLPSTPSSIGGSSRRPSRAFLTEETPVPLKPSTQTFRIAAEIEAGQHPDFHLPAPGSRRVSTVAEIDAKVAEANQPPTRRPTSSLATLENDGKSDDKEKNDNTENTKSGNHDKRGQDDDEEWESEEGCSEDEDEWVGSGKGFWGHLTNENGRFRGREHEGSK